MAEHRSPVGAGTGVPAPRRVRGAGAPPAAAGGRGLVRTVVPRADRERHHVPLDRIEGLIDVLRKTAEADAAFRALLDDTTTPGDR
ncbi:hypothetical protein [Streptomyces sp. SCUT-3]|uniref:hypothetical protein n=1 Tax=Streptomyces sp. SCUT-3 TaxID=2684469 RepID=UPI0015FD42D2|nr:hypothetical protein [Streptomyces sp. SCUT-3]